MPSFMSYIGFSESEVFACSACFNPPTVESFMDDVKDDIVAEVGIFFGAMVGVVVVFMVIRGVTKAF